MCILSEPSCTGNKVLLVGCDDKISLKLHNSIKQTFAEYEDSLQIDLRCMSPEEFQSSHRLPAFDIIVINQALLKASYNKLKPLFIHALKSLNTEQGSTVLVNGMLPALENPRMDGDWSNQDAFQLLLLMRNINPFDAALSNFEGGLLVVLPRQNPYGMTAEAIAEIKLSYNDFRKNIDKFVPVLSFAEMHEWLSHPYHTKRFVKNLYDK